MKKSTLLNVLLVGVLIGSIVLVNATHIPINITTDPEKIPPIDDYDPFADVNSISDKGYPDGKIDMADIGYVASKFATEGNSVRNVTITDSGGFCGQQPGVYADVAEITVLEWTAVQDGGTDLGAHVYANSHTCLLHFNFAPKNQLVNVTDLWIIVTDTATGPVNLEYDITINNNATYTVISRHISTARAPIVDTVYTDDINTLKLIQAGINTLKFSNVISGNQNLWIYKVKVFIGYIYEVS